jgi:DNA-directed RNA polymerase subunit RPC12/RpoP
LRLEVFDVRKLLSRCARLRLPLRQRIEYRCRGCGRPNKRTEAQTIRLEAGLAARALCANCLRLVDQLRQDDRITAVFIFGRRKQTKFYAAVRILGEGPIS